MNFNGTFNLFGGANDYLAFRMNRLKDNREKIITYKVPLVGIKDFIKKRQLTCTNEFKKLDPEDFIFSNPMINEIFINDKLILGDSHSLSIYETGWMIKRCDYVTLYRVLENGINSYIKYDINHLKFYFGNIDIRFHLYNREDSIPLMIKKLEEQLKSLNLKTIEITAPLFIEDESRRIPKSGLYKGNKFNGSFHDRNKIRILITNYLKLMCERNNWFFYEWPNHLLNDNGQLDMKWMESKQSVHLNQLAYRYEI